MKLGYLKSYKNLLRCQISVISKFSKEFTYSINNEIIAKQCHFTYEGMGDVLMLVSFSYLA